MDLRAYYHRIREVERQIADEYAVIVSHETSDGGRAGVRTETSRAAAARLIVDGRAHLATPEEAEQFRAELRETKAVIDQASAAGKVQVAILSDQEVRSLRERLKPQKG